MERRCELKLGVCKTSPKPTQPTGTNNTVPTIALTEWAEASTRTLPSVPMPVWWSHRIEKSKIKTVAEPNRYRICHSDFFFFFFYEANKTMLYVWVLLKKQKQKKQKQKQNDEFYDRFQIPKVISSYFSLRIFFSQNLLTLSRSRFSSLAWHSASLELSPSLCLTWALAITHRSRQNNGKLLRVFSFFCLCVLLFFPFHLFRKAESMND